MVKPAVVAFVRHNCCYLRREILNSKPQCFKTAITSVVRAHTNIHPGKIHTKQEDIIVLISSHDIFSKCLPSLSGYIVRSVAVGKAYTQTHTGY